jgi:ubiquitin-like modifier-activating enzyme ATG7
MRYIITVEFWKKLAQEIASKPQKEWDIVFQQNKSIWYLNDFSQEAKPGKMTLSGRLVYFDTLGELTEYQLGELPKETEVVLLVSVNLKQFVFYQQLCQIENGQMVYKQTSPYKVDLAQMIDPIEMLKSTGKNNLTLMKYRHIPTVNLDSIYQMKCLILGTGTLGCNIARNLIMWGIESITFIDNGQVSHSNLLRQSLFEFSDIGAPKAVAAADRIAKIFPPAKETVRGFQYSIPMPDHPDTAKELESSVIFLEELVKEHDLVFLCTDNKESRWLPTLMAVALNKPLINLAVGFDSWVVMRHPLKSTHSPFKSLCQSLESKGGGLSQLVKQAERFVSQDKIDSRAGVDRLRVDQLGCYFCTSVEGIVNTIKDRQIDERCTVTRGGTASISSAYAVELAISLLTHPSGFNASAEMNYEVYSSSPLSVKFPPQQLRGSIGCFNLKHCLVRRNPQCCACSTKIVDCYLDSLTRLKFLESVCQDSQLLKRVTRLDQFEITSSRDDLLEISDEL